MVFVEVWVLVYVVDFGGGREYYVFVVFYVVVDDL